MIDDWQLAKLRESQTAELALLTSPAGSLPRAARAKLAEKIVEPAAVAVPEETAEEKSRRLRRARPPRHYLSDPENYVSITPSSGASFGYGGWWGSV